MWCRHRLHHRRLRPRRQVSDFSVSRWQWLKRPRWAFAVGLLFILLGWVCWPIPIYRNQDFLYAVVRDESKQLLGVAYPDDREDPWEAKAMLEKLRAGAAGFETVREIGDEAFWMEKKLHFRTMNLTWRFEPAGKIGEFESGEPEWEAEAEALARRIVADLEGGRFKGARTARASRGYLYIKNRLPTWRKRLKTWLSDQLR